MTPILCFSTVDWDHLWYHPQALMSRFARDGYPVVYVDTVGLRSPTLRDYRRIGARVRNRLGARGGRVTPEGVRVYSPLLLPFLNSRMARRLNVEMLVYALKKMIRQIGAGDPILWVYLPTWTVLACANRIPHRMLVYNSIDALSESPHGVSRDFAEAEAEILQRADLVLTTSETLYREKAPYNGNTHWAPSGVDEYWFEEVGPEAEVMALPGPRIGFFGAIDHRIDLALIAVLARRRRDWTFVLIGPVRGDVSVVQGVENVRFLGAKPHGDLVRYVRGLDVLFLPYVIDGFTQRIQPAKLFECMAVGQPIVATRLPALTQYDGLVRLADDLEGFDLALQAAVAEDRPDLREKRREVARGHSWERRYREILKHVGTLTR